VGIFFPNIFTLTNNIFINKIVWKLILTSTFSVVTLIVGVLCLTKLIKGKVAGGKARIFIYLFILIILYSVGLPLLIAFVHVVQWIIYFICGLILLAVASLITILTLRIFTRRKTFKITQQKSIKAIKTEN
jgi:hypothetical protein